MFLRLCPGNQKDKDTYWLKSILNIHKCSPCVCSISGAVFIVSLKIGEDDGVLEINRKLAGRVKVFYLTFCWILKSFSLPPPQINVFLLVFVSSGWLKCCSDLSDKGVQRRRSKWSQLAHFLFCVDTLAVKQVVTWSDIPWACLSTQHGD